MASECRFKSPRIRGRCSGRKTVCNPGKMMCLCASRSSTECSTKCRKLLVHVPDQLALTSYIPRSSKPQKSSKCQLQTVRARLYQNKVSNELLVFSVFCSSSFTQLFQWHFQNVCFVGFRGKKTAFFRGEDKLCQAAENTDENSLVS